MQSQFSETDLEAKHKWIYVVVPLSVGPFGPGGGIYSSTEDVLCRVNFTKNDLEAKQSWIYAVLLLSVGPVGPGGVIYSIIDYVVCTVYLLMDQVDHVIC